MTDIAAQIKMQDAIRMENVASVLTQVESGAPLDVFAIPQSRGREVNALGCILRFGTRNDIERMVEILPQRCGANLAAYLATPCSRHPASGMRETPVDILLSRYPADDYLDIVQKLTVWGAPVPARTVTDEPLVHVAVNQMEARHLQFLIDTGADLKVTDLGGRSLHDAVRAKNNPEMTRVYDTAMENAVRIRRQNVDRLAPRRMKPF